MTSRHPFSTFLNYLAYDASLEVYLNQDCSLGMLWECTPLTFAGPKDDHLAGRVVSGRLAQGERAPADPPRRLPYRADSLGLPGESNGGRHHCPHQHRPDRRFHGAGEEGPEACGNIPVRNFRLLVAVKLPGDSPELPTPRTFHRPGQEKTAAGHQTADHRDPAGGAALPAPCSRKICSNGPGGSSTTIPEYPEYNFTAYDERIPLRKQIINAIPSSGTGRSSPGR
jgi:conjugal transfer ATP-binding protein TraC